MTASADTETAVPQEPSRKSSFFENVRMFAAAIALFLIVRVIIFQPFTIPSPSMEPGLIPGDYIIVTKWDYGWSRHSIPFSPSLFEGRIFARDPKRGDVVVFKVPSDNYRDYIKRVVGLPGDRIQMKEGRLYINGEPVALEDLGLVDTGSEWRQVTAQRETLPGGETHTVFDTGYQMADDTEVFLVPEDHFFMMGDNRDNSLDSRFPTVRGGVGFVAREHLIGKARFILLSWDGASLFKPWTWFLNANPGRFFKGVD